MRERNDRGCTKGNVYKLGWAVKSSASLILISVFLYVSITTVVLFFSYLTGNEDLIPLLLNLYTYFKWGGMIILTMLALLSTYALLGILLYTIWGDESH